MVKFWKEDFKYIKRFLSYYGYCYIFSVRGESANYLMNKYDLEYPNVYVNLFTDDNSMTVASKTENKLKSDVVDIDEEDSKKLLYLLQEDVDMDLTNYEEYICNDIYKKDSRWK